MDLDEEGDEIPALVELPSAGRRIPITVLTGFLGSGKTTLLNYILTQNHGKKIAVIENEFSGGLGIEAMIAKSGVDQSSLQGFFELNNGCICCSVKDDLVATLEQLAMHRNKFDYILIEATGVADPGPVISSLWVDDSLGSCLALDSVVTVVDLKNITGQLLDDTVRSIVEKQIAYADRILLNKADIATEADVVAAENAVCSINGIAERQRCSFSRVDINWVIDVRSFRSSLCTQLPNHSFNPLTSMYCQPVSHVIPLGTFAFSFEGRISLDRIEREIDRLLYHNGSATEGNMIIFRLKAVLHSDKHPQSLFILQGVHQIFDITKSSIVVGSEYDSSDGLNKVIVIGKNLDTDALKVYFLNCLTPDAPNAPITQEIADTST